MTGGQWLEKKIVIRSGAPARFLRFASVANRADAESKDPGGWRDLRGDSDPSTAFGYRLTSLSMTTKGQIYCRAWLRMTTKGRMILDNWPPATDH